MIIRSMPNGQLLCIHQTSHALMAEEFCRHWGNREFARPGPYSAVMLAIGQHDNGWTEWEQAPQLCDDGTPMDFLHGPIGVAKLHIWQRGVDRVFAQHPYAALLVWRHAALLYQGALDSLADVDEQRRIRQFTAQQEDLRRSLLREFAAESALRRACTPETVEANTRLLQFGDSASLQVCMPWSAERTFPGCPVDFAGTGVPIRMAHDGQVITCAPWPFAVDHFTVSIHGRLLSQRTFSDAAAYQVALRAAPIVSLSWDVLPGTLRA